MARGAKDYSNVLVASPVHRVDDMGELAVRLGSSDLFNRAGNVILIDSFEHGAQMWATLAPGGDGEHVVSTGRKRTGAYSLKITPKSTDDYNRGVYRSAPYPATDTIGVEFSFTLLSDTDKVRLYVGIWDGSTYHRCEIRHDNTNDLIQYLDSTPAWQTLGEDVVLSQSNRLFHTMKLVVDISEHEYRRVILDGLDYAHLELPYYTSDSVIAPKVQTTIEIYATHAQQPEHWVDDVIVTVNEP